jgi:glycosyltransferase involved in cell wall biosynthesis
MGKSHKLISIVIPAYNEENTLASLLEKVVAVDFSGLKREIIIINDGSKDKTREIAENFAKKITDSNTEFKIFTNDPNRGKSQSVKRGILKSTGDLVVIQDADLEYEPSELKLFVDLLMEDREIDVIYGNRFGKENKVIYWQNYYGNRFLTLVSNLFTLWHSFWVSDMEVCYKMVRGEVIREIAETIESSSNFGFEPEVSAKLAKYRKETENGEKERLKLVQIPISYHPRSIEEGKHMKAFQDGMKALVEIIRYNLFR